MLLDVGVHDGSEVVELTIPEEVDDEHLTEDQKEVRGDSYQSEVHNNNAGRTFQHHINKHTHTHIHTRTPPHTTHHTRTHITTHTPHTRTK